MKLTHLLAAAAAPLAIGGILLTTAGQASAAVTTAPAAVTAAAVQAPAQAPKIVIAATHRTDVPDTTSVSGPATPNTPQGPQWAWDDLGAVFTVTPVAGHPGTWNVRLDEAGTYRAFADPNTGAAWNHTGLLGGWVTYTVTSTGMPSARNLPANSSGAKSSSDLIRELFGDPSAQVTVLHYWFSYGQIDGQLYTQQG
jgi:hypothetical protein